MMMRDHFVLDDDYDDDMIWWDYLYVYAMITFVCVSYAKDYSIKPIQIQNKYAEKTTKISSSEWRKVSSSATVAVVRPSKAR